MMNELGYVKSVKILRRWAKAYYQLNDPVATDEEYDVLYHKVLNYEQKHEVVNPESPTQFVGWVE